jgi:hypothetical protein
VIKTVRNPAAAVHLAGSRSRLLAVPLSPHGAGSGGSCPTALEYKSAHVLDFANSIRNDHDAAAEQPSL